MERFCGLEGSWEQLHQSGKKKKKKKKKLFQRERCGISQTWHMKKHTSGGGFITIIRTFNMKIILPFPPPRFGIICLSDVIAFMGYSHSQISKHIVFIQLNARTRQFSGGSGGNTQPLICVSLLDVVPIES